MRIRRINILFEYFGFTTAANRLARNGPFVQLSNVNNEKKT